VQFVIVMSYLLVLLTGLYFARSRAKDDATVAGRSLPQIVLAGTLPAALVGSGVIVGGASFVYQYGPVASIFFFAGAPAGILILYFSLADRIQGLDAYTVPEILEIRYGPLARAFGSVCILLAYVGVASYQFTGGGYVLNIITGIPAWLGTLLTTLVVIFLATIGRLGSALGSALYTDAIGAALILGALLIWLPRILGEVGGFDGLSSMLPETQASWNGGLSVPQLLGYFLPLLLILLGDQNIYQRLSSKENPETARRRTIGFLIGTVAMASLVIVLATCSIVLLPSLDPDTAILSLADAEVMPTVVGGLLLAAAAGIMITTGNFYLLSSASNLVYEVYIKLLRREIPEGRGPLFDRAAVILLGALACTLGILAHNVLALQIYSYTIYGAGITPALVAALLWRRATVAGGVASIITGVAATLTWDLILRRPMEWNGVMVALPLSIMILVVASLATSEGAGELAGERAKKVGPSA
jgi:solute:Na+ symporter, SSS family